MFVLNFDKVPTSVFSSFNNVELSLGSRVKGETDSASKRRRCPISGGFTKNTWQRRNLQRGIFCLWEFNSIFLKGMYNSFREISIYQQIMELTCKFLFFFFKYFYFVLEYSWFTMLYSFRCTAKWFSYTYTHINSFKILFPFRLLQTIEYNSLCYRVGPCLLSILNIAVCTGQSQTHKISLSPTFPLFPLSPFLTSDLQAISAPAPLGRALPIPWCPKTQLHPQKEPSGTWGVSGL